jgi:hypothetical protein
MCVPFPPIPSLPDIRPIEDSLHPKTTTKIDNENDSDTNPTTPPPTPAIPIEIGNTMYRSGDNDTLLPLDCWLPRHGLVALAASYPHLPLTVNGEQKTAYYRTKREQSMTGTCCCREVCLYRLSLDFIRLILPCINVDD